jgi:MOSC domain-containing protein YiiM
MIPKVLSCSTGAPKELISLWVDAYPSSISKQPLKSLTVHKDRIQGDEVANKTHHGGDRRVLHAYPDEHYQHYQLLYPKTLFPAGSMGENIRTCHLLESQVCIGDIYQIGTVICQVTEPRKPCASINHQFQIQGLARQTQDELRAGWFFQIINPGVISVDDEIFLKERSLENLSIAACIQALLVKFDEPVLVQMSEHSVLSQNWKEPALTALKERQIPDGRNRLGENDPSRA